jgi:hypothetical protein
MPRVLQVLTDLQAISEGVAAQAYEDRAGGRSAGSEPPPGFDLERGAVHRDEESLYDEHLRKLELWLIHAEEARDRRRWRSPDPRPSELDDEFAKRVDIEHRGKHDVAVALREGCSVEHVRKARALLGLDEYGFKPRH